MKLKKPFFVKICLFLQCFEKTLRFRQAKKLKFEFCQSKILYLITFSGNQSLKVFYLSEEK